MLSNFEAREREKRKRMNGGKRLKRQGSVEEKVKIVIIIIFKLQ